MEENQQESVNEIVSKLKDLPTLPSVLEKIVKLTSNPNVDFSQVEKAISTDPVISTKLLRIVNSAYFSFFREITSLRQAIVVLGLEATKNLVYGTSIINSFGRETKIASFPLEEFWKYSVACGNISRTLSSLLDYSFFEEAFLSGLVHAIGKIVVARYMPSEFEQAILAAAEDGCPLAEKERELIGFDHTQIGHQLGQKWRLPKMLNEVVLHYQEPALAEDHKELAAIVRISSIICRIHGIGISGEPPVTWDLRDDIGWKVLSQENEMLEVLDFDRFNLTLDEEIEKVESFIGAAFA